MIPGAGSSLGTAPTGPSASARAPGRGVEPAPASYGGPNGDQPDDPWSPPGEPPVPGEPDPWVPNPNDQAAMTPRGAVSPDAHLRVTAGTSPRRDRVAPDGPGPAAALNPTSRFWLVLVDDDALWLLDPRKRITNVQVAGGAL